MRPVALFVLLLSLTIFAEAQTKKGAAKKTPAASSKKIPSTQAQTLLAEGKYEMKRLQGTVQQTFQEPWKLYKTNVGFLLQEQWISYSEGASSSIIVDVELMMAPGMFPIEAKIGSPDSSNRLLCSMALKEFKCTTRGLEAKLAVVGPYNLFLPSPFILGSIARRGKKTPGEPVKVKLVQMSGISADGPKLEEQDAEVEYQGDDQLEIAGQKINASIYEIRVPKVVPSILLWVSNEGIVLAMQDAARPDQRMELTEYTPHVKF
jgi:hypothetical protein